MGRRIGPLTIYCRDVASQVEGSVGAVRGAKRRPKQPHALYWAGGHRTSFGTNNFWQ